MKQINFKTVENVVDKFIKSLKNEGNVSFKGSSLTKVKYSQGDQHLENKMVTSLSSAIELKGDKAIEVDLIAMFKQSGDGIDSESIQEHRAIRIKISFIKAVLRTVITIYNAVATLEDLFRSSIANLKELAKSGVLIVDTIRDLKKVKHVCERKSTVQSKYAIPVDKYLWDVSSSQAKAGSMKLMSFIRSGYVNVWVTGNTVELFSHNPIAYLDKGVILYAYPTSHLMVTQDYVKFTAGSKLIRKIIAYNKKYAKDLKQSKLDHAYQELSDYVIKNKISCPIYDLTYYGKMWVEGTMSPNEELYKLFNNCGIDLIGEDDEQHPNSGEEDTYAILHKDQVESFIAKVWKGQYKLEGVNSIKGCRQSDLDRAYEVLSDYVIKHKIPYSYRSARAEKMWIADSCTSDEDVRKKLFHNCGIPTFTESNGQYPNSSEWNTYAIIKKDQISTFIPKVWKGHQF